MEGKEARVDGKEKVYLCILIFFKMVLGDSSTHVVED